MQIIYCNIDIFNYNQFIHLKDEENDIILAKVPIESMERTICNLCNEHNVDEVAIGGLTQYAEPIKTRLENECLTRYNKKINVTLIKGE